MSSSRIISLLVVIIGVLLIIASVVYVTHGADTLPTFFPGHDITTTHKHIKHGIASFLLGLGAFAVAWFQSGPKKA